MTEIEKNRTDMEIAYEQSILSIDNKLEQVEMNDRM